MQGIVQREIWHKRGGKGSGWAGIEGQRTRRIGEGGRGRWEVEVDEELRDFERSANMQKKGWRIRRGK